MSEASAAAVTVRCAVDRFLSCPRCANPNTRPAYSTALDKWAEQIGPHRELGGGVADEATDALTHLWAAAAPGTWNRRRASLASFLVWCRKNKIPAPRLPESSERRPDPADETRAMPQAEIERLLSRGDVPLREKTLWRMLYEAAARAAEILVLNVEVLDLERRRAPIRTASTRLRSTAPRSPKSNPPPSPSPTPWAPPAPASATYSTSIPSTAAASHARGYDRALPASRS